MSCKFSDGLSIKPDYTIEAVCTTDDAKHMINKIKNIKYGRKKMKRDEILHEAESLICGDRDQQYGSPENSFCEIAKLWADYLDRDITAHDVAIMMSLFKIARIKTGVRKGDNYADGIGYLACACEIGDKNE